MTEVVAAFQKIAQEGKRSAKETEGAFKELNKQFAEVGKNLLAGLSIVYAADKLKELFQHTLETADGLVRLQRQTGLSTDAIQAFGRAALENGVSTETANQALVRLTANIGKAQTGSRNSQLALRELGTSFKELSALTPDQRLQFIATALAGIPDPGKRARIEMDLLGKSGTEVDQALVHLGQEGIGGFLTKLRELGTYLDAESIQRLQHLGDNLRDLRITGQGLGTQFLVGLAPSLERIADQLVKATSAGEGFRTVGEIIGAVFRGLVLVFDVAGKTIGLNWALIMNHISGSASAAALAMKGHFLDAEREIVNTFKRDKTIISEYAADVAGSAKKLFADATPAAKAPEVPGGGGPGAPDEALAQAHYQLIVTRLDNELKLFQAHNQLVLQQDKAAYDAREISLKEYFARRVALINADFEHRIATAKAKLAAEQALPLRTGVSDEAAAEEKRVRVEKLRGEIADLNAQKAVAVQQETNTLHQEEQRQTDAQIKAEEQLLTLAGRRADAERKRLALAAQALDKELAAGGVAPAERQAAVGQFTQQGAAKIDFDEASRDAAAKLVALDTQKKAIQDQINAGQLFSLDGQQRILALERAQLPALEADAKAMADLADKTKDPAIQAQAAAFNEKLQEIKVSTDLNAAAMKEYRAGIEQAIGSGLNTFLDDAIFKSKSLGAAFSNAVRQMITDLAKLALKIEEEQFLRWIFSGFGGGGGKGGGAGLFGDLGLGAGAGVNAAGGGYIRGPGSTTSDSIPAFVSDQEYIVNAAATRRPGVLQFLDALNAGPIGPGSVGRFAAGTRYAGAARAPGGATAPPAIAVHIAPAALNMTLRDWFEREIADIAAKR